MWKFISDHSAAKKQEHQFLWENTDKGIRSRTPRWLLNCYSWNPWYLAKQPIFFSLSLSLSLSLSHEFQGKHDSPNAQIRENSQKHTVTTRIRTCAENISQFAVVVFGGFFCFERWVHVNHNLINFHKLNTKQPVWTLLTLMANNNQTSPTSWVSLDTMLSWQLHDHPTQTQPPCWAWQCWMLPWQILRAFSRPWVNPWASDGCLKWY